MTIASKLASALRTTPLLERDAAAVELTKVYARQLDALIVRLGEPEAIESATHHRRVMSEIDTIGRRLEAMLDRLGMAPGARPAVTRDGGGTPDRDAAADSLDGLRADAAAGTARVDYAAAVDASVTAADAGE